MEHYVKSDHGTDFKWESFPVRLELELRYGIFPRRWSGDRPLTADAFAIQLAAVNPLGPAGLEDWRRRG